MMTVASSNPSAAPATSSMRTTIGTLLCRVIVPLWLVAGALFKLSDLNPNVLPGPVKDVVLNLGDMMSAEPATWLVTNMRAMIAVELALVGIMLLVPRLARPAAIAILTLFCVVLAFELANTVQSASFKKKGFASLLEPCGCFGAWSPPTIVTFMIDCTLLIGTLACPQGPRARRTPGNGIAAIALVASLLVGPAIAFGKPAKTIEAPPSADPKQPSGQETPPNPEKIPPTGHTPPAAATTPWPAMPTKLAPTYVILDKRAIGKPFASLPTAGLLAQQVPADIQTGRKTFVFYRETCDHCFEMMNKHFSGKLATPTYSIKVPDSTGGKVYTNPCKDCVKWELPKGPDYMIETPMVMTIVDGMIAAICKDAEKPGALDATLNAWLPGHEKDAAVPGMVLAPMPAAGGSTAPANAPPAAAASKPFPPMPTKLEAYYAPDFDKWTGKRLDELDLPLIITRPLPLDVNAGEVVILFYRVDCEHCEQVLNDHFSGVLTAPTLLVAVPDAAGTPFQNPCNDCKRTSLVQGPTYVIETPVLVVAKDGVVQHVLAGSQNDNPDDVKAVLPKATAGEGK